MKQTVYPERLRMIIAYRSLSNVELAERLQTYPEKINRMTREVTRQEAWFVKAIANELKVLPTTFTAPVVMLRFKNQLSIQPT